MYITENTRRDRCRNIATAIKELKDKNKDKIGITTNKLREYVRNKLKLPALSGEDYLGDLRAHGDAIGGHGLHINVKRAKRDRKSVRVVEFTDENIRKCDQYLTAPNTDDIIW